MRSHSYGNTGTDYVDIYRPARVRDPGGAYRGYGAHVPDQIMTAIRSRERDGALDLPTKRGPRAPKVGDRVPIIVGPFVGHSGVGAKVTQHRVEVLLFVFGAQRGLKLRRNAIEVV
jgi:transcription antitermination factor NusG